MQDVEPLPSRRSRRALIALLTLLLILLPLYLWPLRGGLSALPGVSWLPRSVRDPRSAAAVAQISGDVWDALMGHTAAPPPLPPSTKPPRNLTMITEAEGMPGGGLDGDAGGAQPFESPSPLARGMLAQLGGVSDLSDGASRGGDGSSAPAEFLAGSPYGGSGPESASSGFGPGGYPGLGNLGPWIGGGPGGGPGGGGPRFSSLGPSISLDSPGDPLAPTPEPATLVLVGSNLALLGAVAWRRRRR